MMAIQEQLESFRSFAARMINAGAVEGSLDDLYDLWRSENIPEDELLESASALRAAYAEMQQGDTGVPVEEHLARLRAKYQILDEP